MHEDSILNRIDIERALAKLAPVDAEIIRLVYGLVPRPSDWGDLVWPPTNRAIGRYVGLSEAGVRCRRDRVLELWASRSPSKTHAVADKTHALADRIFRFLEGQSERISYTTIRAHVGCANLITPALQMLERDGRADMQPRGRLHMWAAIRTCPK